MKLFNIIPYLLLLTLAISCSKIGEDDLFDKSPAVRLENFRKQYTSILEKPDKGWVFQYFALNPDKQGGENYFLKFKDGYVTAKKGVNEEKSMYTILNRGGSLLSFNLNNKVLLDKAIQRAEDATLPDDVDFQFLILSATEDKIVLKGLKTGFISQLVRMKNSPQEYLQTSDKLYGKDILEFKLNGDTYPISSIENAFSYNIKGTKGITSYIHTDKGIRFYESITIDGVECYEFTYDEVTNQFKSEDGKAILKLSFPLPIDFSLDWETHISSSSPKVVQKWAETKTIHESSKVNSYGFTILPLIVLNNSGMTFLFNLRGSSFLQYKGLKFKGTLVDGEVGMVNSDNNDQHYDSFFSHMTMFSDFIISNAPYKTEIDDVNNPKIVKLISLSDPNIWLIVGQ